MIAVIKSVALSLFSSLVTEAMIKKLAIYGMRFAAAKTQNKEDDKLVEMIVDAWK